MVQFRRTLLSDLLHKVHPTKKSGGLLFAGGLYEVNHFIKSVGPVPWDIPSCKRALKAC
jgi:hypothetical protein